MSRALPNVDEQPGRTYRRTVGSLMGCSGCLFAQSRPNPMCRVPLLARCLPIGFQHPLDVFLHRTQLGLLTSRLLFLRRDRAGNRLPHHPPCTPCFFASSRIVSPAACPRRISSNSSTLLLLSIPESCHSGLSRWGHWEFQAHAPTGMYVESITSLRGTPRRRSRQRQEGNEAPIKSNKETFQ